MNKLFSRLSWPLLTLLIAVLLSVSLPSLRASLNLSSAITNPASIILDSLVWLSAAWVLNRLIVLTIWDGVIARSLVRKPPRLIVQLSGAIGIVIGFALRNLILDTFSGLAIHLERPFKVGDWINCHTRMGDYIGRVEETNWRTTRLWTTSRNLVIVPNSYLTSTLLTNFSMPGTQARFELDFVLDFSVPSERALMVLSVALVSTIGPKGPLASPAPKVRVNGTTEYGVQYRLRYYLEPEDVSPSKARNTITQAVVQHINSAGLSISYPRQDVFYARMPWRQKDWSYLKDQIRQLSNIGIFKNLEHTDLEHIATSMTVHNLDEDTVVVTQGEPGESMYVLAEGLLEVLIEQSDGTQIKVADLAPGTFFGEKSLLTGEPRSATIVCAADSVICEITKTCVSELLDRKPDIAEILARAMAERDLHNELAINRATKEEVEERVSTIVGNIISKIFNFFGRENRGAA